MTEDERTLESSTPPDHNLYGNKNRIQDVIKNKRQTNWHQNKSELKEIKNNTQSANPRIKIKIRNNT